jgi:hypothetical protein
MLCLHIYISLAVVCIQLAGYKCLFTLDHILKNRYGQPFADWSSDGDRYTGTHVASVRIRVVDPYGFGICRFR